MKIFNSLETLLIKNNFKEIFFDKKARFLLIFIPLCLCIILPGINIITASLTDIAYDIGKLQFLLPLSISSKGDTQKDIYYISTNVISPMLFTIIPTLTGSLCCSVCYIGEKENKTICTLSATCASAWQIINSKIVTSITFSWLISLGSGLLFIIVSSVGDLIFNLPFFFDFTWLVTLVLLSPALSALSVLLVILTGSEKGATKKSYKLSSFILFPLLLIYYLQFTGAYRLSFVFLLLIGLLISVVDVVIIFIQKNNFDAEKFLR